MKLFWLCCATAVFTGVLTVRAVVIGSYGLALLDFALTNFNLLNAWLVYQKVRP